MDRVKQTLLDFSQPIDVPTLDAVVRVMMEGSGKEHAEVNSILTAFKQHPEAWMRVDRILELSQYEFTRFFGLQVLEEAIATRWNVMPREQCEGIKGYIVSMIIKISAEEAEAARQRLFLLKLDKVLVQILKHEWPQNWPTFISDIVGASKTNESLCENNMRILQLLSEDVFDYSATEMTQAKARRLKDTMCDEFVKLFDLCVFVLEMSSKVSLVSATLDTLLRFLNWIPLGYIFETNIIETLVCTFLKVSMFRNIALKCLTEIASLQIGGQYEEKFVAMFTSSIEVIKGLLGHDTNIREAYRVGSDDDQLFVHNLSLYLTAFLKEHSKTIEAGQTPLRELLLLAHSYLVSISEVDDTETFKICLEYWIWLTSGLYNEQPYTMSTVTAHQMYAMPRSSGMGGTPRRRDFYAGILSRVRLVMISKMAKPEEVLVVENEQGEVVREHMKDTDAITMYKNMRECLVYLTHLDYLDTEKLMTKKLERQVDDSEWSWKNLNTLCWAIGSISGAMAEEDEKRFLVNVIKDLLGLCEKKRGKDNKAVIASNIMYIVGQYPRFLRAHWKFLKTVINKLFEFMHETHDGVQDMACDTFIKIAQKCRRHFVTVQVGEVCPFVEEIITTMPTIVCDLQPLQIHTFYEAVGHMIGAQSDALLRERWIEQFMHMPNQIWESIVDDARNNPSVLENLDRVRQLSNILKINIRACTSIGHAFVSQLARIYYDMLNVYKCVSEIVSMAISSHGETATRMPICKAIFGVKKDTLKLIETWVTRSEDPAVVMEKFLPPLFDAVLNDYQRNIPQAREPEVLFVLASIINKLKNHITPNVPMIFNAVFGCTLDMINKDFEVFPEHRTNFFLLLEALTRNCFAAFFMIPPDQFKLVIDSIVWAFRHTMRNVAETGLVVLYELLQNVNQGDVTIAQMFFQTYLLQVMQHMFAVLTDMQHKAGFKMHATILAHCFYLVESGRVTVPLYDSILPRLPSISNSQYLRDFVARLLSGAFPHLTPIQIEASVNGMAQLCQDLPSFKKHLRDFLVQIKEFAGQDNRDLFLEETENDRNREIEEKRKAQLAIPGLLNPFDRPEEMAD
eukprot:Opistho-2@3850